jgi:hypothetical protein
MHEFKKGDIVFVPAIFEGQSEDKNRSFVIVGSNIHQTFRNHHIKRLEQPNPLEAVRAEIDSTIAQVDPEKGRYVPQTAGYLNGMHHALEIIDKQIEATQ